MSKNQTKPTSIDVDAMPEETVRFLAASTLEFIQELMHDPETRKLIEERVTQSRKAKSK